MDDVRIYKNQLQELEIDDNKLFVTTIHLFKNKNFQLTINDLKNFDDVININIDLVNSKLYVKRYMCDVVQEKSEIRKQKLERIFKED